MEAPIFHRTPQQTSGRFVMCFMAFMMERKPESLISKAEDDEESSSPDKIR
jgi:hypothetical protein